MPQEANPLKITIFSIALLIVITACSVGGGSDEDTSSSGKNVRSAPATTVPAIGNKSDGTDEPGTEGSIWTRQFGTEHDEEAEDDQN